MADFSAENLIQSVVNSTNRSNQAITQGQQDLGAVTNQIQSLLTSSQTEMTGAIQDAQKVAGEKAAIDYSRNKTIEDIQKLYRMDPTSNNFAISEDMATYEKTRNARVATRQEYDQLNSVDFTSNPLGWIVAQTKLPQVAAQNNALADKEDEALQDIRVRNELLSASKNTITANVADAIQANQLDEAAVKARASNAELSQKTAQNLALVSSAKLQQIQLEDKKNDNERSAIGVIASIQNAQETRAARLEARESNAPYKELVMLQLQERIKKMQSDEKERANMDIRLAEVSKSLGHQVPMTMDRLEKLPEKEKISWFQAAQVSGFGATLDDSTEFFLKKNNLKSVENASVQATARKLEETGAAFRVQAETVLRGYDPSGQRKIKEEDVRNLAYEMYTQSQVKSMFDPKSTTDLSSKDWDKTYNVYVAPFTSFSKAIDTQPELAGLKNNAVKKQIDILVASGAVKGDNLTADQQQQVLTAVRRQVQDKQLMPRQAAAEVSAFFGKAVDYNRGMNKYNLFALPDQSSYQFTMEGAGKADMLNPTAVENALTRGIAKATAPQWGYTPFGFR